MKTAAKTLLDSLEGILPGGELWVRLEGEPIRRVTYNWKTEDDRIYTHCFGADLYYFTNIPGVAQTVRDRWMRSK